MATRNIRVDIRVRRDGGQGKKAPFFPRTPEGPLVSWLVVVMGCPTGYTAPLCLIPSVSRPSALLQNQAVPSAEPLGSLLH